MCCAFVSCLTDKLTGNKVGAECLMDFWVLDRNITTRRTWLAVPYHWSNNHCGFEPSNVHSCRISLTSAMDGWMPKDCARIFPHLTARLGIPVKTTQRLLESSWKAFWFLVLWLCTFHTLILSGRTDFQYPLRMFKGVRFEVGYFDVPTPPDYYRVYLLQLGFYLHSLWSVLFVDVWRKDSAVLIVHHFMTLLLLQFSLVLRLHRIGALVVFLHDLNDVFLEIAKVNVYLQTRHGKKHPINVILANLFFTLFTMSWKICEWHPG
ncbi:hypothetical protein CRM22_009453 [Opisthorchis felineus]|uniref:TLC domain-containing protein n=1 Tax=Opisthorchis felineus TaxID=147828 RepID=A0A4S2LDV8_OPIFE|nr:hypothetical protein CRM22_009453 [Opisthorchis felineus]